MQKLKQTMQLYYECCFSVQVLVLMMSGMTQNQAPSSKKKKQCIRQADVILKEPAHVPAA